MGLVEVVVLELTSRRIHKRREASVSMGMETRMVGSYVEERWPHCATIAISNNNIFLDLLCAKHTSRHFTFGKSFKFNSNQMR